MRGSHVEMLSSGLCEQQAGLSLLQSVPPAQATAVCMYFGMPQLRRLLKLMLARGDELTGA